jgi:tetratricopeptide (TPR) repeat protein
VAARGRVNHLLQGAYAKAGDNIRINVTLQQADTGELIGSESVEGKGEESIFSMVDELTRRVKTNFKLSEQEIASDIDKLVGKITTSSPEAYRYYSEGAKHYIEGDFRKAIQFFKQAVAKDPEFATAYRSMSAAYSVMGYRAESRKYRQKALELSDRVSDRERYRIQGDFYRYSEKTYDKAIEAYHKLLDLYPEDLGGNNNLGTLYQNLEEWDKSIERYEVLIQNKEEFHYPYIYQAESYAAKGLYDKARQVLENYINNYTDNAAIRRSLAIVHLCQGKYDFALVEVDKGLALNPAYYYNQRAKGDIFHCKGNLTKAEQEYQKLMEYREPAAQAWGVAKLASLYFTQGRFKKAKDLLKQGVEWGKKAGEKWAESNFRWYLGYTFLKSGNPEEALRAFEKSFSGYVESESVSAQRFLTFLKGLAYLELNSIDKAQKTAAQLKEMTEKGLNKKAIRFYYHLMGMIELERKNFPQAVENFKKAISLLPFQHSLTGDDDALFIDPLASYYYRQGDLEKAGEEYEKIISLTSARLPYGDIYTKAFYLLGKIYEQKGWKGKAIEHYEKFLDLWKDADPGIPEVIEAKKHLASLQK